MVEHKNLWWKKMVDTHGSEEAVRAFMRENQKKSRENYKGTGGFKHLAENDPEALKEISLKGVKARQKDG